MLTLGGAALAGLALTSVASAQTPALTDTDYLNFALNAEYLEANFYTLAATGRTLSQAGIPITGVGVQGAVVTKPGGPAACLVPFTIPLVQQIATEIALDEQNHIKVLQQALGAMAVAQPQIDLYNSFNTLWTAVLGFFTTNMITATALASTTTFDPFASDINFLLGAYIFEVGVSAYTGAAPLLTMPASLDAGAGLQAIEAYHYGAIRTAITGLDLATTTLGPAGTATLATTGISGVRAMLDGTGTSSNLRGDDLPLGSQYVFLNGAVSATDPAGVVSQNGTPTAVVSASSIVNATATVASVTMNATGNVVTAAPPGGSSSGSLATSRTPAQVLSIVYAGQTGGGGFFPAKLNGNIK